MHMSDALLSPVVAGTMYAASAAALTAAVAKVRKDHGESKVAEAGVMGAFVFAAQMINFAVPGTGSSGHICGGMLLSAVLGPAAGFLTMAGVLLVQCLLFADGGILALGANIWNMGFYGCMIGGVIWQAAVRGGFSRRKILAASVIGNVIALQLGAFSVTLQTLSSGVTELPFVSFVAAMQPIHLAIGLVEGLVTASVLLFIYGARPEMLRGGVEGGARLSRWSMLAVTSLAALVIGGFLSLAASSCPDGLEWSMERVAGTAELVREGALHVAAADLAGTAAVLPDYSLPGLDGAGGGIVAGIAGTLIVLAFCASGLALAGLRGKRT